MAQGHTSGQEELGSADGEWGVIFLAQKHVLSWLAVG